LTVRPGHHLNKGTKQFLRRCLPYVPLAVPVERQAQDTPLRLKLVGDVSLDVQVRWNPNDWLARGEMLALKLRFTCRKVVTDGGAIQAKVL
jgi:hypothetical protein